MLSPTARVTNQMPDCDWIPDAAGTCAIDWTTYVVGVAARAFDRRICRIPVALDPQIRPISKRYVPARAQVRMPVERA